MYLPVPPRPEPENASPRRLRALALVSLGWVFGCCIVPGAACRMATDWNTVSPAIGATAEEVLAKYGPPDSSTTWPDGHVTWFYPANSGTVWVNFDSNGRVSRTCID
jgi:hypothetical protein